MNSTVVNFESASMPIINHCFVPTCHNTPKTPGLSFHRIPNFKDFNRRKKWIESLKLPLPINEDKSGKEQQRICSVHFSDDSFETKMVLDNESGRYVKKRLNRLLPGTCPIQIPVPTSIIDTEEDNILSAMQTTSTAAVSSRATSTPLPAKSYPKSSAVSFFCSPMQPEAMSSTDTTLEADESTTSLLSDMNKSNYSISTDPSRDFAETPLTDE